MWYGGVRALGSGVGIMAAESSPKYPIRTLCVLAAMLTGAAQAAELTLAQEGRIKVSQCYATCLADATRLYPTYLGASLDVWEAFLEGTHGTCSHTGLLQHQACR